LNTDSESLQMTDAGSEFQTHGAAHQEERFTKSVQANGWMNSGVAVECSVRALTQRLMAEVPWYRRVQSLVCQHRHLVVNSVLNRQLV